MYLPADIPDEMTASECSNNDQNSPEPEHVPEPVKSTESLPITEPNKSSSCVQEPDNRPVPPNTGETQTKQQPGMCWACKWSMKKLKKQISNGATPDDIKKKLEMVCDEIGFLKSLCRKFVNKYKDTLVEELSTTEDTETICINIGVCKK
ncbi:antimicrobial peptide NK-lysin-like [Sinocyclocheilus rhinocerous]|uniref:antimicrobial peptide NK-lysin-like n=1 Tax=Sinocyclocheilus rhinocerous TaxID=307959 RepID=UPI0007BA9936|nr:PREDICTED: antimicrobial peptide NK-lysin-like [Sinocyclocheilus rhinocerous]